MRDVVLRRRRRRRRKRLEKMEEAEGRKIIQLPTSVAILK